MWLMETNCLLVKRNINMDNKEHLWRNIAFMWRLQRPFGTGWEKLLNEWDEWEWSTAVRQRRIDWPCHPVLCQFMDLLLIEKLGFTSDLRNAALNCINIYIAGIFMHCRANVEFLRNCNMESRLAMTAFFLRGCSLRFRRPLTNLFHQE